MENSIKKYAEEHKKKHQKPLPTLPLSPVSPGNNLPGLSSILKSKLIKEIKGPHCQKSCDSWL